MADKVFWHVTISLDGFSGVPPGSTDWTFEGATEPSAEADEVMQSTGAILAGRRWWDGAHRTSLETISVTRSGQIANFRERVLR